MRRLNNARVGLKHHGTFASSSVIEEFSVATERFFIDNTSRVFGIEFAAVSLIEAVSYAAVQAHLHSAQDALEAGDMQKALDESAIGFARLLDDYEQTKRGRFGRSPFFFGKDMRFLNSFFSRLGRSESLNSPDRKLAEFVDKVTESVEAMQEAMKLVSLGLDYRRYARFQLLTPHVHRTMGSEKYMIGHTSGTYSPTADDGQFCIDFVIESALRLQEFDFTVEPLS